MYLLNHRMIAREVGKTPESVEDDGIGYWDGSPLRRRNAALTTLEAESLRVSGTHDMSQGIAK